LVAKSKITNKEHRPEESKSEASQIVDFEKERTIVREKAFILEDFLALIKLLNKNVNPDKLNHSYDIFYN
jgi:hypothetical protein